MNSSPHTRKLLVTALALGLAGTAQAQTLGMVVGIDSGQVMVFDADSNTVLGSIPVGPGGDSLDCAISNDQSLGFVSGFYAQRAYVVNPAGLSMASGINQIPLSVLVEDLSLSADQQYLLAADAGGYTQLAVASIATRAEIASPSLPYYPTSVEACADNSVLATDFYGGILRRLTLDASGTLTDTGESLPGYGPFNATCAASGGAIRADYYAGSITSVLYPPLTESGLDTRNTSGGPITVVINSSGQQAFVRTDNGSIQGYSYDPVTGALGAAPFASWSVAGAAGYFGVDQMALHPDGSKLFVSEGNALNVYDTSGNLLATLTDPGLAGATGVCLPKVAVDPGQANLRLAFSGPTTPVRANSQAVVYARLDNYGRDRALRPLVNIDVGWPVSTAAVTAPGWTCTGTSSSRSTASSSPPPAGPSFQCQANAGVMPRGSLVFKVQLTTPNSTPNGFVTISGIASSASSDPVPANNAAAFKLYVKNGSIITPVKAPND